MLARSDKSANKKLRCARQSSWGGSEADTVIHLTFNHDLFALPGGLVQACAEDTAAIFEALVAAGPGRTFINSSGTLGSDGPNEHAGKSPEAHSVRNQSELLALGYTVKGLRTLNVRLAPVVHGPGKEHPFISVQIALALSAPGV